MDTTADTGSTNWPTRMTLVLAFAGLLFFARLSERALWSEEVRWAQIPREMVQSGDYLWPTLNGRTYYDKPLGSYWLVLLASLFTGGVDETSARLPSACSGLLAVAFAMLIARRIYDDDTAILTGVILATSFSFVFFARNASADVETIAGVLAALWLFLRNEDKPPGGWTVVLWFVMALTSLTKGLLGFVLPVLIITLYSALKPRDGSPWVRARQSWLLNRWSFLAVPLAVLVYLGPFFLSMAAGGSTEGLEMVYRENVRRFFDPVNHRAPIYLYAYVIFMLLAPWSLLLPAALVHAHFVAYDSNRVPSQGAPHDWNRTPRNTECGRAFALAYFWGTFIFFTLSSSRRSYYLLPILPAAAFLIARMLTACAVWSRATYAFVLVGFSLLSMAVLLSIAALLGTAWLPEPWDRLPPLPCPWAFVSAWLLAVVSIGYACLQLCPRRIAWSFGVIAFSFMAYLYLFALPATEGYRTQKPFADAVKQLVGPDFDKIALYRTRDIVFYLDAPGPIAEYHTKEEVQRGRWVILRRRDWDGLKLIGNVLIEETVQPWEEATAAENKLVLVQIR